MVSDSNTLKEFALDGFFCDSYNVESLWALREALNWYSSVQM